MAFPSFPLTGRFRRRKPPLPPRRLAASTMRTIFFQTGEQTGEFFYSLSSHFPLSRGRGEVSNSHGNLTRIP